MPTCIGYTMENCQNKVGLYRRQYYSVAEIYQTWVFVTSEQYAILVRQILSTYAYAGGGGGGGVCEVLVVGSLHSHFDKTTLL